MADLFTEQTFALQEYEEVPNGIGGYKEEWTDKGELSGFLDLFSGATEITTTKMQLWSNRRTS